MSKYIIRNMVDSLTRTKSDNNESITKIEIFQSEINKVSKFLNVQKDFYKKRIQESTEQHLPGSCE